MNDKTEDKFKCSGDIKGIHSYIYIGKFEGNGIYKCRNCGILRSGRC